MATSKKPKSPTRPAKATKKGVTRATGKLKSATQQPAPKKVAIKRRKVARKPAAANSTSTTKNKTPAKKPKHLASRMLKPDEIEQIFKTFKNIDPDPKGELESVNTFTFLVAVVLSAQATDAGVNKATRNLFAIADTPQKMLKIGEDRLRDYIKTIGLFRNKAKNVIALSRMLIDEHNAIVPPDRDTLETLPGVGRKTANVIMNVAFGEPTMAVDTHVLRISNRIGLSNGKNPLAVEKDLLKKIPSRYAVPAHHWLILHGRYLCKARKPECWRCPISNLCNFKEKTPAP